MKKKKVEFTEVEANNLITLLDALTKAYGLKYAKAAVIYVEKIQNAFSK